MPIKAIDPPPSDEQLFRLPTVRATTGKSKPAIYVGIREGTFPAPLRIGKRAVAWRASEIRAWIESRAVCTYAPLTEREAS